RDKVELITEPLSSKEYWDLLSSGDIVLLPYDRDSYYARSSGILAESLAAGIPSLVPAGTWMAKQFVGEIYRHQLSLRQMMEVLISYHGTELRPRRHLLPKFIPREGAKWLAGGRDSWTYCFLTPPKRATHLLISFKIIENLPGNFVEVY